MSQNLQNVAKFQKSQLDNLVDFEKCCQTHIYLQNLASIQPRTSLVKLGRCPPSEPAREVRQASPADLASGRGGRRPAGGRPTEVLRTPVNNFE